MWLLYNIIVFFSSPLWGIWMWMRTRARKEQPNWRERRGTYPFRIKKDERSVWIHAVSVGEVVASLPILAEIRKLDPRLKIILSVTTSSGHQTAREHAASLCDHLVYFPIDLFLFQMTAMGHVRPKVVAIMETELWFNFLEAAKLLDAKRLLINGRISDRSFPRALKIQFFYSALLERMDRCLMQTETDAERIKKLGAKSAEVLGNCKFDQAAMARAVDAGRWRSELGIESGERVIVIGSTRGPEEEAFVLDALASMKLDGVRIIHAPRHMERVPELALEVQRRFGDVALRSKAETGSYVVLDTYGELAEVYGIADVVIIGGGFANHGGQNLIQPLALGKPVIHGPHMQNFADVAHQAHQAGCTAIANSPTQLAQELNDLMANPERRIQMGLAAQQFVDQHLGASKRYAQAIVEAAQTSVR